MATNAAFVDENSLGALNTRRRGGRFSPPSCAAQSNVSHTQLMEEARKTEQQVREGADLNQTIQLLQKALALYKRARPLSTTPHRIERHVLQLEKRIAEYEERAREDDGDDETEDDEDDSSETEEEEEEEEEEEIRKKTIQDNDLYDGKTESDSNDDDDDNDDEGVRESEVEGEEGGEEEAVDDGESYNGDTESEEEEEEEEQREKGALREDENENDEDENDEDGNENDATTTTLPNGFRVCRGMYELEGGFALRKSVYNALYPYQREGVRWLWDLRKGPGGILGDDMGLGKTIQVASFVAGLFARKSVRWVLIAMPVSVIEHWKKCLKKWAPHVPVRLFHGSRPAERNLALEETLNGEGVCITTYGMIVHNMDRLSPEGLVWDWVILDEGHKIKNPAIKLSRALRAMSSKRRLLITGTPIQNNLQEMWALYDYITEGKLLGSSRSFKDNYGRVITHGYDRDATPWAKRVGAETAARLRELVQPYFLRREKRDVLDQTEVDGASSSIEESKKPHTPPQAPESSIEDLPRKNDFIVWIPLSETQRKLYEAFLRTDEVGSILNKTKSALSALTVLKKICDHPKLLSREMAMCKNLDLPESNKGDELLDQSTKLSFLDRLLDNLHKEGHKVLIFSQSVKMLNLVEKIVKAKKTMYFRIDGSITSAAERQKRIDTFNKTAKAFVFLLTTQVGGLGITLTGADRVVIVDPAWNPSTDNQAVDRAYRIGQTRNVVVYRLISCGTLEEKIYQKQVFKETLMNTTTSSKKHQYRYFGRNELRAMFRLEDTNTSRTCTQLNALHSKERESDPDLDRHIKFLHTLNIFGISDHNLLHSKKETDEKEGVQVRRTTYRSGYDDMSARAPAPARVQTTVESPEIETMRTAFHDMSMGTGSGSSPSLHSPSTTLTSSPECCTCTHGADLAAQGITMVRCSCKLNYEEKRIYNDLLYKATDAEKRGDSLSALDSYMSALERCDENSALHGLVLQLGRKFGFI